ncbi:e5b36d1e-0c07-4627-87b9-4372e1c3ebe5 [Thermothielavioides terrestris]|uniref:E5b36d1e-0c07-4627-87b9-4372e1c3ebe5 n=1 Tax=Thermothielavioides terrestris TaxID=2587410 RepID=A0A446BD21_9PEZI|nr:e5b36d1e-0c07-4627-87b9-4372e1c3ebe5 [Thermothielavioides terrestris]
MPPPNTPEEDPSVIVSASPPALPSSRRVSSRSIGPIELSSQGSAYVEIDYPALEYVGPVDDALLCPICRNPLYDPLTTPCRHTFCSACLEQSIEVHSICPIDRKPLPDLWDCRLPPLIVNEQLDRLKVKCPNTGCGYECSREHIAGHCERQCQYTPVRCPDPGCTELVARGLAMSENQCLHYDISCKDCGEDVTAAEFQVHLNLSCDKSTTECTQCHQQVVRHRMGLHKSRDCPEEQTECRWHEAGCKVADKRRIVQQHEESGCMFEGIGRLLTLRTNDCETISALAKTIGDLSSRLATLEAGRSPKHQGGRRRGGDNNDRPVVPPPAPDDGVQACLEEYILPRVENLENKLEGMQQRMMEREEQHSLSLQAVAHLNDQIAEVNNKLGVLNMHTTWLLNRQRQQSQVQQQRAGSGAGSESPSESPVVSRSTETDGARAGSSETSGRPQPGHRRSGEGRTGTRL